MVSQRSIEFSEAKVRLKDENPFQEMEELKARQHKVLEQRNKRTEGKKLSLQWGRFEALFINLFWGDLGNFLMFTGWYRLKNLQREQPDQGIDRLITLTQIMEEMLLFCKVVYGFLKPIWKH